MIKFDKNEFLKPQIYSTLNEYETRCNVTKEIIEEIEQLQQENQQLKLINKEYERLNKENFRGFKITNVKEYDIDELLSYKKYKDNWTKLRECLKDVMNSSEADDKDFVKTILDIIQEIEQESDSNDSN
mgnify:CR=1 FL=1